MENNAIEQIRSGVYSVMREQDGEISFYGVFADGDFTAIIPLKAENGDYGLRGSWGSVTWINRPIGRVVYEDFLNRALAGFHDRLEYLGGFRDRLEEIVRENDKDAECSERDGAREKGFDNRRLIDDRGSYSGLSKFRAALYWVVIAGLFGSGVAYFIGEYLKRK